MWFKQKHNQAADPSTDLVLPALDGTPWVAFPLSVIHPMRRLISRLDRKGEIPPRLAMAAALRQEGVSYVSWAFATTMAFDLETTVCVVDLNWWWPSEIYARTAVSGGLGAVLTGDAPLDRAVIQTGKPNLTCLPSGILNPSERSYFARSAILKDTILELGERYDHLVLDVPAVLASNDAISLASLATAVCLVIHQGATSIDEVKATINDLDHLPFLGVVMNKYRFDMPEFLHKVVDVQYI